MMKSARYGIGVYGDSRYGWVFITGSVSFEFTVSGEAKGKGKLVGLSNFVFSPEGDLTYYRLTSGNINTNFSLAGSIGGLGDLEGNIPIQFTLSASLLGIDSPYMWTTKNSSLIYTVNQAPVFSHLYGKTKISPLDPPYKTTGE